MIVVFPYIIIFLIACILFCVLMATRNQIVYRIRVRATDIIFKKNREAIKNGDYYSMLNYDEIKGSYNKMLFQFDKWTFKQFYPSLLEIKND